MLRAHTIKDRHSDLFTYVRGNAENCATQCNLPEGATGDSLVYVSEPSQLEQALRRQAAIIIVRRDLAASVDSLAGCTSAESTSCCFSVAAIPMAMAVLLKYFDLKAARFTQWGERHPSAVVHSSAVIGEGVFLGPYCVIGANATVGNGCFIGAHTVVENEAKIGERTILHPHVFIGAACEIGFRCEIHPHTSIGSDGFGYTRDSSGRPRRIPQLGNVKIGDEVEIGSNCAIDRATLTSTWIRSGTKLDNICHIAHNCDLGENGFYTAGFMMAGSTKIGRNFATGGNSVVSAHLTVADDVVLAGRSSVTNDITAPGQYGGYPLQPLREALKTSANIRHLNEIRRNLRKVMKHLHLLGTDRVDSDCVVSKETDGGRGG